MHGDRPDTLPMTQPLLIETVNQQQMKIDRLCDAADQGMYSGTHHSPSPIGRLMRLHSISNIFSVQQRMRNRYDENEIIGTAIMTGGIHSKGASSIQVEEDTIPHPTMKGIATQITLWSLKH